MDHDKFLRLTLEDAEMAQRLGCTPVGALVVDARGGIISRGRNRVLSDGDQTLHAEVDAIRNAGNALAPVGTEAGAALYTSAEPCLMCLGAILYCSIRTVVWAAGAVLGSSYDAVLATPLAESPQYARLPALKIVREPSPEARLRSRALLHAFYLRVGETARSELLKDE